MPKKVKVKSRFDGGINTKSSAKDIGENDLVSAKNVFVNQFGTIKSGGKAIQNDGGSDDYTAQTTGGVTAGYGFYQAQLDHKTNNDNTTNTKTFLSDVNGSDVHKLLESEDEGAFATKFTLTDANQGLGKNIFHIADGNIRVADANFENNANANVKWFGHIKKTTFKTQTLNTSGVTTINGYFAKDNTLTKPTATTVGESSLSYPNAGGTFEFYINDTSGGSWDAGVYQFAITWVYDGNQESLPRPTGTVTVASDSSKIGITVGARAPYNNERISGSRIYIRDNGSDDPWVLFADIDISEGIRTQLDSDFSNWSGQGGGTDEVHTSEILSYKPNVDTYESINGFPADVKSVSIGATGEGYKTSVVANGRTFVANIKAKNEDDETLHMPDRIMYSQTGKYDTFPTTNFIDIGVNDGDEFIKLESFADRLFAYKKNKLYIINISGGADTQWYLETEYNALGVESHNSVVKVDLGIIWANENGLYLYDGSAVNNLQNKIDDQTWFDFCTGETLMIGYLPRKKEIVVMKGATSGNTDAYIYHLDTKSFVYVDDLFPENYTYSNLILDKFNKLTAYGKHASGDNVIFSYDGKQVANSDSEVIFNFDDFGDTKNIKKLYKVIVTYSSQDQAINEPIKLPFSYNYINESGTLATGTLTGDVSDSAGVQTVDNFLFNADGSPIKAQALQLKYIPNQVGSEAGGTETSKWEINDITVVYRTLGKVVT